MKRSLFAVLLIAAAVMTAESAFAFGFWVKVKAQNGKYGYMEVSEWTKKSSSKWKIAPMFDDCAGSIYIDGYATAKKEGKWGVIDSKGHFVVQPQFAELASVEIGKSVFDKGAIVIAKANPIGKWGAINMQGEFVIPPVYDKITPKSSFSDIPLSAFSDGRLSYISPASEPLFVTDFECRNVKSGSLFEMRNPSSMVVPVKVGNKWGAVGRNGTFVVEPIFDNLDCVWNSDMALVGYGGKFGVIDRSFGFLIKAVYDAMSRKSVSGIDYFIVKRGDRYGAVDINGDIVVPIKQKSSDKVSVKKCEKIVKSRNAAGAYDKTKSALAAAKTEMISRLERETRRTALSHSDSVRLGREYHEKACACSDLDKAAYWHNRAAWLGDADSQSALASILCDKRFVPKPSYGAIFAMLDKSFSRGVYDGAKTLGECWLYGRGTRCDYERAINAFMMALARDPSSSYIKSRLGDCYYALGTMGDCIAAREFYRQVGNKADVGRCDSRIAEQRRTYEAVEKRFSLDKYKKRVPIDKTTANVYNAGVKYYNAGNYRSAYNCFKKAADAGMVDAVIAISRLYQNDRSGFADASDRLYWYRRYAGETGYPPAFALVGDEYSKVGNGREAYRWYKPAADVGYAYAQYRMGYIYETGMGVGADAAKAEEYYKKAAAQNNTDAQHNLARLYNKLGNSADAAYWYRLAAEQGNPSSMTNLAILYSKEDGGLDRNLFRTKRYAVAAAVLGNNIARYNIGLYYSNRNYTDGKPDYVTAKYWFRQGAADGDAEAMRMLGWCYYYGNEAEKDDASAYEWMLKAAQKGDGYAMCYLAWFYAGGSDVVKTDKVQARKWYDRAVASGEDLGRLGLLVKSLL